jgi:hypothetical protein
MHKNNKYSFVKKRFQTVFQLFFLLFLIQSGSAQVIDTLKTTGARDTVILKKQVVLHSPRKAALYSTMLPGLGQVYNKKYWKVGVLYAGLGALTYAIVANNKNYQLHRSAYRIRMDGDSTTIDEFADPASKEYMNDDFLLATTKGFHRWRDLSIFGAALVYVLNIVDASVDAHLFSFDVSDDLSLRVQPTYITTAGINRTNLTGLSIRLNFK